MRFEKIYKLIKRNGITLYKLANVTGVTYVTLWNMFKGGKRDCQLSTMLAIVSYLRERGINVTIDDLYD